MNKILLIFAILKITSVICEKYDLQLNVIADSTLDPIWLIQSTKNLDKISCLVSCNINKECYTASYTSDSFMTNNCFLYRKQLTSIEMISTHYSNIYIKQCNAIRTLNDTACLYKRMFFFKS
jgi:hypothetical protein